MKVLIVIPHLRKGGPVDVEYNLCKQLCKASDVNLSVLTLRKEAVNSRLNDFNELGIPVTQLNLSYAICEFNVRQVRNRIQRIVEREKVDIVHCHGYHPVLACARLKGVKKVSTLHDRATEDFINVFGKYIGKYMLWRYFKALKRFDLNIGVSQSVAELYGTYIPNVTFVNNGINVERFFPVDAQNRMDIRRKLGLPTEKRIMVSSGRIEKEKHYEELIDWFVQQKDAKNIILLILGDGKRLEYCKEIAIGSENIVFTGRVSNVVDYLKCSDYYISNSQSEGMSMAVCEGIGCGLFPVLSDIPSHRDVGGAVGGMFFKQPEEIDLPALLSVHEDRDMLHSHICQHFSIESMGKGYIDAYQSII